MTTDDDPDTMELIPNPQTELEREFNASLLRYRESKKEYDTGQRIIANLKQFSEDMKDPNKRAQFTGSLNQLSRGHVSETERREFAWLTKKVGEARTPEQKAKAEQKLANWKRAHAGAYVLLTRENHA